MCNIEDLDYFLPSYYNYRLKTNFTMLPRTLNKNLTNNGHYEFIERKTVVNLCRKKEWTKLLPPKIDSIFLGRKQLLRFDEILSVICKAPLESLGTLVSGQVWSDFRCMVATNCIRHKDFALVQNLTNICITGDGIVPVNFLHFILHLSAGITSAGLTQPTNVVAAVRRDVVTASISALA